MIEVMVEPEVGKECIIRTDEEIRKSVCIGRNPNNEPIFIAIDEETGESLLYLMRTKKDKVPIEVYYNVENKKYEFFI